MSRARNLADLLDASGDVKSGSLDNVPASNDASALTTGTLPIARIADGAVTAGKLNSTLDLTGKTVTLPSGVGGKVLNLTTAEGNTGFNTSSSSFVNTPVSITVTPTDTGSTILLFLTIPVWLTTGSDYRFVKIVASGGVSGTIAEYTDMGYNNTGGSITVTMGINTQHTSHNTTSAITYQYQVKTDGGSIYFPNDHENNTKQKWLLTALEVA